MCTVVATVLLTDDVDDVVDVNDDDDVLFLFLSPFLVASIVAATLATPPCPSLPKK